MNNILDLTVTLTPPPADSPDAIATIALSCEALGLSHDGDLLVSPVSKEEQELLQWYLEEYWLWPYMEFKKRGKKAEALLEDVGKRLFEAISDSRKAARIIDRWNDRGGQQISIKSQVPAALSLPWELLHDEQSFLALRTRQPVSILRRLPQSQASELTFTPPLRVLLVTARPSGSAFLDPRGIARELFSEVESEVAAGRIVLEFLRPPTLKALRARLRESSRPVHLLHFDGHGTFHTGEGEPQLPQDGVRLSGGAKGMLAFENDEGTLHLVPADQLANVLSDSGVHLAVLTACQSAMGSLDDAFSSVAARLIQGGVDGVVAMSRSVLFITATRYVEAFYRHLAQGTPVPVAHERARQALHDDPRRNLHRRRGNEEAKVVQLHDWWLPHYYQQRPLALTPSPSPPSPSPTGRGESTPLRINDAMPSEPLYGFSGRARELLTIERALLRNKLFVLHGFGGIGKTALAREAADWLTQTDMYAAAYFHSFEHGSDAVALLSGLGTFLGVYDSTYNLQQPDTALAKLRPVLAKQPLLIIADNLEDILPLGNAPLPAEERKKLWDVLFALKKAGVGVLLTTRDTTFGDRRLAKSRKTRYLQLEGLAKHDAYTLATRLLDDLDISRRKAPYAALRDLLKQLDHHPLAIQLVLPALERHSLDTIRQDFAKLLNEFKDENESGRNRSLLASLDYSLRRLSEAQRALLPRLAVFEGGASEDDLLNITEIPETEWQTLRAALEQAALITPERVADYSVPFLCFHPVLVPFLRSQLRANDATLRQRYAARYHALAKSMYYEDSRDPISTRVLVRRDLPNLRHALHELFTQGDVDNAGDMADKIAWFLNFFGMWRERDEMLQKVTRAASLEQTTGFTHAEFLRESNLGEAELQRGNFQAATQRFTRLLTCIESLPQEARLGKGSYEHNYTLLALGRCFGAVGQLARAYERLYEALTAIKSLIALKPNDTNYIHQHAALLIELGNVLTEQGNYATAEAMYEEGLKVVKQQDDTRGQAVIVGQLGTLALRQYDYNKASQRYHKALSLFDTMNEPTMQAIAWHQLGMIAGRQKQFRDAERCLRQALTLNEQQGNTTETAKNCNQLALVAKAAGKAAEAERWYKRALGYSGIPASHEASYSNNLAALLLDEELANRANPIPVSRLAEARDYAERALAIKETLDLSTEPWTTYMILAQIAEISGRSADAQAYRRRKKETFAVFAGNRWHIEQQHSQLIANISAAAQGNEEARAAVEEVLPELEKQDWRIADATRRIWAGERDWHALCEELDNQDSLIVKIVLEKLADSPPVNATDVVRERDVVETPAAPSEPVTPEIAAMFEQFEPLLQAIVAVARGDESQRYHVELFLPKLEAQGWHLSDAVQRIWAGERDVAALTQGLDEKSALLVRRMVAMVGA